MKDLYTCRKCNSPVAENTDLVGGYHTRLCQDCRNLWHVYIRDQPAYLEHNHLEGEAGIIFARTAFDGVDRTNELHTLVRFSLAVSKELYALAEAWVMQEEQHS